MPHRFAEGVERFRREEFESRRRFFQELAAGQKPRALFITCSDSRINPHLVTQSEPGELFVIRNAGNIVPRCGTGAGGGEAATIEFAVKGLGVPQIIVCGHSLCGAMTALLDPRTAETMPLIVDWVRRASRALDRTPPGPRRLDRLAEQNVLLQLEHLRTYDFIRDGERAGALELTAWMYHFQHGDVSEHDPATGRFASLLATGGPRGPC